MNKFFFLLTGLVLLGAGCIEKSERTCNYQGHTLSVSESYFDGCNYHTCQENGEIVSTEMACEPVTN
ncbi:MAG: hypothetical protein WCT24_01955 [Patescibacteria group bacterium]